MSAAVPIVVLLIVLSVDLWVFSDAREQDERGRPIVFSAGSFEVDTPTLWLLSCLVLFIVFVPLYLVARGQDR